MPGKVVIVLEAQDKEALTRIRELGRGVQDTVDKLKASQPALEGTRVSVRNLTSAKVDAFKATQQWQGALVLLPGQLGSAASQASTLASALRGPAGLAVGLTLAATAAVGMLKSLGDDIERLDNLKRQTGLAVSSLQAFEQAAREAGESPDTLVQGLGRVNQAINDVLMGTANAGKAFQAIGVDLRALVRDGASTEQILEATAKALAAIPDPTARAAAQMELFGTRGRAMSTVLDAIAQKSLPGYVDELREAGIVTSEETNKMAREFDAMFDRMLRASQGFWTQFKADAAAAIVNVSKMIQLTRDIFADPAAAGRLVQAQQAHEIVRPGVLEAGPAAPRVVPPSPEDKKAIEEAKRLDDELFKLKIAGWQAVQKEQEEAAAGFAGISDRERAATQGVIDAQKQLEDTRAWREMEEAVKKGTTALEDHVVNLHETGEALQSNLEFTQGWAATEGDVLLPVLQGVTRELEGQPESLMAIRTEADQTFIRMRDVVDGADGSVERLARQIRTELPSAFEEFGAGFQAVSAQLIQGFATWEAQGAMTAGNLHTAFEDSFFALMKGNLDDFDDIWKTALDAVLRQIAAFLASEAVNALLHLGADILKGLTGGSLGSSPSASGIDVSDVVNIIATGVSVFAQQTQATEAQTTSTLKLTESTQGATTAMNDIKNAARAGAGALSALAHDVGGAQTGDTGPAPGSPTLGRDITGFSPKSGMRGAALAAPLGPGIQVVAGLFAGIEIDGKTIGDRITAALGDLVDRGFKSIGIETTFGPAAQTAKQALDMLSVEFDAATAGAQAAAQAAANTAAAEMGFAADLDIMGAGLNPGLSTAAAEFGTAATDAASAVSEAATAAGEAAGIATGAAADARAAANDAANSAADAAGSAADAGGGGSGGGGAGVGGSSGAGGGHGQFQTGLLEGPVPRTGWAKVHRGEVVATPDQAAAILAALQRGSDGPETVKQLRRIADRLDQASRRGGRLAGAAV